MTIEKRQKKSLGQVFLIDQNIQNRIIQSAQLQPNEHILEIGCGNGILSQPISDIVKTMSIIEIDRDYANGIHHHLNPQCDVTIINTDFNKTKFSEIPKPFKLVANIPYQISSDIIQALIESATDLQSATLMVQKEYADRLLGKPGSKAYGALSIFVQFYMHITRLFKVSKHCFRPVPKIDSTVIQIIPRNKPLYTVSPLFFDLVKASFWGRRKTLLNCLKNAPHLSLDHQKLSCLDFFKETPKIRGETLSIDSFYELYQQVSSI